MNLKRLIDLNAKQKPTILEDNIGENLVYFWLVMTYQIQYQKHKSRKKSLISWTSLKLKISGERLSRTRTQATNWEKIFVKDISDKVLSSKACKEFLKLNKKTKKLDFKMGQRPEQMPHQRKYIDGR